VRCSVLQHVIEFEFDFVNSSLSMPCCRGRASKCVMITEAWSHVTLLSTQPWQTKALKLFRKTSCLEFLPRIWRRLIGCLKLQIIFCKKATNHRALSQDFLPRIIDLNKTTLVSWVFSTWLLHTTKSLSFLLGCLCTDALSQMSQDWHVASFSFSMCVRDTPYRVAKTSLSCRYFLQQSYQSQSSFAENDV